MKRIAIIGGGISGLAAAFALEEYRRSAEAALEYVLYESSTRLGGVLRTEMVGGCVVEAGPDSFLTEKPWATELCRALGIEDQLIGSSDTERKTYILSNGRLVPMPDGLMFLIPTKILPTAFSPLFSWKTKLRMAREFSLQPHILDHDESVAALVERHYGTEMVERLADPLLSGIYGGAAADLSVRAVLPRFVEMERTHGSLGRALLAARKNRSHAASPPIFTSLKNGMQSLADAVVARLPPGSLRLNTRVMNLHREGEGWSVTDSAGHSETFDAVIVAVPTYAAASILRAVSPELSAELAGIQYSSTITVALGYNRAVRRSLPPGFGFLVPRSEGQRLLAATFVHNKFPHRAPADRALLRCFVAGISAEHIWPLSDDQILGIVRNELQQILGLSAEPLFFRVYKWKSAMAQYGVGHLDRLDRMERLRRQLPGLALAGNGYRGIGIPDCIRSGRDAANEALTTCR